MTKVYCYRENCINRSGRKSQMKNKKGEPLYRCKKYVLVIQEHITDGEVDYSKTDISECLNFADKRDY